MNQQFSREHNYYTDSRPQEATQMYYHQQAYQQQLSASYENGSRGAITNMQQAVYPTLSHSQSSQQFMIPGKGTRKGQMDKTTNRVKGIFLRRY
jgi:hypothetical protein